MRLGIDAREIEQGVMTGIGRPLLNFLEYFSKQHNQDHCVLFSSREIPFRFNQRISNVVIKEKNRFLWDQFSLLKAIKQAKLDLFYSPYYKFPFFVSCPVVCAILDLMYLSWPDYKKELSLLHQVYYKTFAKMLAKRADYVLTCSSFSKKDIERLYRVRPERIKVIPLSVGDIYKPATQDEVKRLKLKFNINRRYILYLGNFKKHKNVTNVLKAFAEISFDYPDLLLVLAGPKTHTFKELQSEAKELFVDQRIVFTDCLLSEDNPHVLYTGAEVVLMPSLYEGFGLPVLEAMACGTPVVTSNGTSLPEVVGDAALKVDPLNVSDIALALRRILNDDCLKEKLVALGFKQVEQFSSKKVATLMYQFFKEVINLP